MKMKAIMAAIALIAGGASSAQAATSRDTTATGNGDVVFQIFDGATNTTLDWDLATASSDLTSVNFYDHSVTSLSLGNSSLNQFLATASDLTTLRWRVLGVSEVQSASPFTIPSPNYGAVMTQLAEPNVSTLRSSSVGTNLVTVLGPVIAAIGTGGTDANSTFDGATNVDDAVQFVGGTQGFGAFSQTQFTGVGNALVGLGALDFYYIQRDPNALSQTAVGSVLETRLGTWSLSFNGAQAVLNYSTAPAPVPVPAAVWMFGSAMAGLAGLRRRRA